MKKAIVTGAHGYIGSVLTSLLKENGYYVIGVDNTKLNLYNRVKYCDRFCCTDFVDEFVLNIIKSDQDISVFHLAANSLLGPSAYDPLSYFSNNTAKTIELIKSLGPNNNFINASTAAVYNNDSYIKKETDIPNPPNNYGLSKLMVEQVLNSCYHENMLKAASFRFFNVIGAYNDMGQLPDTPHIVNQLIDKAINDEIFIINGNSYETKDGTCVRDYLHVVDVARALIHMDNILRNEIRTCHEIYNLGTKTGTSVFEIVNTFNRVTGTNVKVTVGENRIGDPSILVSDPTKFITETDFKYKYTPSDLDEMIKSAWDYRNTYGA